MSLPPQRQNRLYSLLLGGKLRQSKRTGHQVELHLEARCRTAAVCNLVLLYRHHSATRGRWAHLGGDWKELSKVDGFDQRVLLVAATYAERKITVSVMHHKSFGLIVFALNFQKDQRRNSVLLNKNPAGSQDGYQSLEMALYSPKREERRLLWCVYLGVVAQPACSWPWNCPHTCSLSESCPTLHVSP